MFGSLGTPPCAVFLFDVNIAMTFEPDIEYVIDQIADAYIAVQQSLAADDIDLAVFWEQQLTLLVRGLAQYVRENP